MSKKMIIHIFSILFFAFFVLVLYMANTNTFPQFIRTVYDFPGGDKVGHVVMLMLLSFAVNMILRGKRFYVFKKSLLLGSIVTLLFITLEELHQIFIPTRTFDLLDLMCSYIGIGVGDFLARKVSYYLTFSKVKKIEKQK